MDNQAKEAKKMAKALPFSKKVRHIYEYYKWHILVPLIIIIAISVTIYQSVTKEKYDVDIAYYGNFSLTDEQTNEIYDYFSQYVNDIDEDGKFETYIQQTVSASATDPEYQMAISTKFMAELAAGTHFCYIFSEDFYNDAILSELEFLRVIDIRDNEKLSQIFANPDEPIYLCVRKIYERELKQEENLIKYNNAVSFLDKIIEEKTND